MKRRNFLLGAGGFSALGIYSARRGIRYPTLSFSPQPLSNIFQHNAFFAQLDSLISIVSIDEHAHFRAYVPEPSIRLIATETGNVKINISNLSKRAVTTVSEQSALFDEQSTGTTSRDVFLTLKKGQSIIIRWALPEQNKYKFAAIGDTGGGVELAWCMLRAVQLDCDFLLHLGDFNYVPGEYDNAIKLFHRSPLPVYISIGNHDFHSDGNIYNQFREQLSPMNTAFSLNGTRFINFDSAADFFPASAGLRGKLLKQIAADKSSYVDNVLFTHRPLHNPLEKGEHIIGGVGEVSWLVNYMHEIKADTLLAGHIHKADQSDYASIKQYISGEGMAENNAFDLTQVSRILIGNIQKEEKVSYAWQALSMPVEYLCHPKHLKTLEKIGDSEKVDAYKKAVPIERRENPFKFSEELLTS